MKLIRYDAARRALAEARAVDEAKKIRDVSEAMRTYARVAKNRQMETDATEIRVRAERRLGELIVEQKETVGLNKGTAGRGRPKIGTAKGAEPKSEVPSLKEAGIDHKLSARAQKLAAVPKGEFEAHLTGGRDETVNGKAPVKIPQTGEERILQGTGTAQ